LSGKEEGFEERVPNSESLILVGFQASRRPVKEFDLRPRLPGRSEALRSGIRAFVGDTSKHSEYALAS